MQLLVLILNKVECLSNLLSLFKENGIKTTVLDCKGISETLASQSIEPPPIFGSLRNFINNNHDEGKLLMTILPEDEMKAAKALIEEALGSINHETGIVFTVSLSSVEGLGK